MGKHSVFKIKITDKELDQLINALEVCRTEGQELFGDEKEALLLEKLRAEKQYPNDCVEYKFQVGDKVRLKYGGDPNVVWEITSILNWFCLGFPMYCISNSKEGATKVSEDALVQAE